MSHVTASHRRKILEYEGSLCIEKKAFADSRPLLALKRRSRKTKLRFQSILLNVAMVPVWRYW